jgi:hypothetical protein
MACISASTRGRCDPVQWRRAALDGRRVRACVRDALTVFMVEKPEAGATLPWRIGEDHDRFVLTEHGWRLVSRRWVDLFARDLVE